MKLAPLSLTDSQVQQLERRAALGKHPRERCRAQAVLSHSRGLPLNQLAAADAADRDTVRKEFPRFEQGSVAALAQGLRSGRPPKLTARAKKKSSPG